MCRKGIPGARACVGNILDEDFELADILDEVPDVCLHLAWRNGFNHNHGSHMLDLSGHYRFLSQAIEFGIPQIACMGSMHEVGYWEGAIDETTPCNPMSLYGIAKDALRRALMRRGEQANVAIQWPRFLYLWG